MEQNCASYGSTTDRTTTTTTKPGATTTGSTAAGSTTTVAGATTGPITTNLDIEHQPALRSSVLGRTVQSGFGAERALQMGQEIGSGHEFLVALFGLEAADGDDTVGGFLLADDEGHAGP